MVQQLPSCFFGGEDSHPQLDKIILIDYLSHIVLSANIVIIPFCIYKLIDNQKWRQKCNKYDGFQYIKLIVIKYLSQMIIRENIQQLIIQFERRET